MTPDSRPTRSWANLRVAVALVRRAGTRQLPWVVAGQIAAAVCLALQLHTLGRVLDRLVNGQVSRLGQMLGLLVLFGVLSVVGGLSTTISDAARDLLAELTTRQVQDRLIDVSTRVDLARFEEPRFHDHFERVSANAEEQTWVVVTGLVMIATGAIGVAALVVLLWSISPLLILLLVVGAIPAWFTSRANGAAAYAFAYEMSPNNRERAYLGGLLMDRSGAKELRVYRSAGFLRSRYGKLYDERMTAVRSLLRRRSGRAALTTLTATLATLAAAILVVDFTIDGRLSVADVAVAVAAVQQLAQRLNTVLNGFGSVYGAALFLGDLHALDGAVPSPTAATPVPAAAGVPSLVGEADGDPDRAADANVDADGGTLRISHLHFAYPGTQREVLHDITLDIPSGQLVALVGENGSGKTTFAKLLCGLYAPTTGSAVWRSRDGSDHAVETQPVRVAALFQDYLCYQLSAFDNIGLGDTSRIDDRSAVVAAAKATAIDAELSTLAHGYETRLSREYEGGADLSVGQWQRVAMARALFRDAPFLVLDEPTAALDPKAERRLYDELRDLAEGRTVLFISHRFSSARQADRVLVLSEGRIVEDGTHDELCARQGTYAELFTMQASAYGLLD